MKKPEKPELDSDNKLPITMSVHNMNGSDDLLNTVKMDGPVPVTFLGKVVGTTDADGTIQFYDCDEARKAIAFINKKPGPIGISSRKMGTIREDGTIIEGTEIERAIIPPKDDKAT